MIRTRISTALAAALVATAVAGLLAACSGGGGGAGAANTAAASAPTADNPYTALAKLPDWNGAWEPMRFARPGAPAGAPPAPPKLTPEYAKQYEAFQEKNRKTPGINFVTNVANCVPAGLPGSMNQPYPLEFLFTPGRVTIIIETYSVVRRIYTDASLAPKEPDPAYQGTSTGHWEGDTLVVNTTGILPETSPMQGIIGHSDQFKVTERIKLIEPDVLEIATTLEDPAVFVEPYTMTSRYQRHRDWNIMEYVCAQNNRDQLDEQGNPTFNLERTPGN